MITFAQDCGAPFTNFLFAIFFKDVRVIVMVRYKDRPVIDREIDRKKTTVLIIPQHVA